ncbi:MAG: helicase [Phycisphaerales bacterium]|nr:helicase [Phycisphaerales bacterium]
MPAPTDILSSHGPLAAVLGAKFEPRPEQLDMARAVSETLANRTHLLVEAGTGVGKSFAYLVPAILRAIEHNETILLATNTIALQEQLITKDIPLLREILDPQPPPSDDPSLPPPTPKLRPVLVKGRGNYISIRRLKLASQRQDRLFPDPASRRSLHQVEEWAYETRDGTLSTLPQLERPGIWDKVQSDSGNCMGRKCPDYESCFYQSARRAMEGANLLVCNHALFFSDLALRAQEVGFLPKYDHVILDEAHGVEDTAADHFGISLSEGRINHLLTTLYHPRTGRGYLPQLGLLAGDTESVERAVRLTLDALDASRLFFEQLAEIAQRISQSKDPRSATPQNWRTHNAASARIREPGITDNLLTPAMNNLTVRLRSLREACKSDQDQYELNAYAIRASEIADDAAALIDQTLPGCAYWIESSPPSEDSHFQRVTLACSPIEVAPILKGRLFDQPHSVILTSATLSTRRVKEDETRESAEMAFSHTISRLGAEGARTLQLGSPFDHSTQAQLVIDTTVGEQSARTSSFFPDDAPARSTPAPTYTDRLSDRILHHLRQTDGGAFVLFTSFATLNAVARRLRPPLNNLNLPMYAQGLDGSRQTILEKFREDERSVLLGAASFWQGVDVRGRGLRNVIITKLPFDPPDRPLTEARTELMQSRGQDPFREDALPRAIMKFKQGFGRLIRSKTDSGQVVVLDARLLTARYGKQFLLALPDGLNITRLTQ